MVHPTCVEEHDGGNRRLDPVLAFAQYPKEAERAHGEWTLDDAWPTLGPMYGRRVLMRELQPAHRRVGWGEPGEDLIERRLGGDGADLEKAFLPADLEEFDVGQRLPFSQGAGDLPSLPRQDQFPRGEDPVARSDSQRFELLDGRGGEHHAGRFE
jgi:hypothetical protein